MRTYISTKVKIKYEPTPKTEFLEIRDNSINCNVLLFRDLVFIEIRAFVALILFGVGSNISFLKSVNYFLRYYEKCLFI